MQGRTSIWHYLLRRSAAALTTVAIVSVIAFGLSRSMPGDPVEAILVSNGYNPAGEGSESYKIEYNRLSTDLGYDRPVFYLSVGHRDTAPHHPTIEYHGTENQYHRWITNVLQGDFGDSIRSGRSVQSLIGNALRWTMTLSLLVIFLVFAIGIPLGMYLYKRPNSGVQYLLFLIYSLPTFWVAILLLTFFTTAEYGAWTNILPSPGLWDLDTTPWEAIRNAGYRLVIPILVVTLHDLAYVSNIVQAKATSESTAPYLVTARSKGLTPTAITNNHLLPNALLPIITILVDAVPRSLAGMVIIEVICNIPGMGRLLYGSILEQDWQVVLAIIMLVSVVTTVSYMIGDLLYKWANPKVVLA